jgi:hypothetical protein
MAKKPADRFPNCRAFADALKAWKDVPLEVLPAGSPSHRQPPEGHRLAEEEPLEVLPVTTPSRPLPPPPKRDRPPAPSREEVRRERRPAAIVPVVKEPAAEAPRKRAGPSRRTWLVIASAVAGAVVLAAGGLLLSLALTHTPHTQKSGLIPGPGAGGKK